MVESFKFIILFLFILSFYEVNIIYKFLKITQIILVYRFDEFFSLYLTFYNLFSYIIKKIILVKNHVFKFYKIIKIKEYRVNHYSPNIYYTVNYNRKIFFFKFLV